ncbi:MAG: hypothetical protein HRT71_16510 [Flavobacteriales bacterium]|nr:hypothetical protein [Flavobacteriales bacterium]
MANEGEKIKLSYGMDTIINFRYNDNVPWLILGDGLGFSITPIENNPTNN